MWTQFRDTSYEVHWIGLVRHSKTKQLLTERINHKGYMRVRMYIDGKMRQMRVHRLTAEIYCPKEEDKDIVNHLNTIKLDCWRGNLNWTDISGNTKHAVDNGLINMNYVRSFKTKKDGQITSTS